MKVNYFFLFTLFSLTIFLSSNSRSQVLFTENFDYSAGDSIGAHGWVWNTGTTNTILVTAPGLTYAGYPLSGIGNACRLRNNGYDAYKQIQADSVGVLYASFMVKFDSIKTPGDYFFAMISPTSTTNYVSRFYAKDSSGALAFGLSKTTAGSGGITYTGGNYSLGTTYIVILKYTFNSGTADDVINAFIFSAGIPPTEPSSPTIGPVTGTAMDGAIGRVALRQGTVANAPTLTIDGIQVAKTWNKIVSVNNLSMNAESFNLSQNYPNPFNPVTNIKFSIPKSGLVNLTVFNSNGQQILTLINENLNTGTYNYNFNGSGLNSGVYFYRMSYINNEGNVISDSKKLILIK